jgi:hypothetical protein
VPEAIVYLLYHTGGDSRGILASAVARAVINPKSPAASPLVAALAANAAQPANYSDPTSAIGHALKLIRNGTKKDSVNIATENWDTFGPDFGNPDIMAALDTYVRTASEKDWKAWIGPRINVVAYYNIYQYLLNIFTTG